MMKPTADPPADPRAFGRELRRLRESAGLVLDDISAETKVSVRVLLALEEGAFQYLPQRVFARNFVRQYARIIGFDEDRLTGWFDIAWERFLSDSGTHPTVLAVSPAPRPSFRWWIWAPLALSAIVIIVAALVIWHQRSTRPFEKMAQPVRRAPAQRLVASSPVPETPKGGTAIQPTPAAAPIQDGRSVRFALHVKPGRECWIRYRDVNGKYAQQLLRENQDVHLAVPAPMTLTLGNAAGVVLTVGTKTYDNLGKPGEVLNLEIAGDGGMKILRATAHNE